METHFERRNAASSQPPSASQQEDFGALSDSPSAPVPPSTRYRYVLFANLGNETLIKDFSDKFYFSMTQLATNANRTSQFLIMKALKLDPGEAMIATVE